MIFSRPLGLISNLIKYSFVFVVFFNSACISNHYERSEKFSFFWKIGRFDEAVLEAERLVESGPRTDRMLYRLEEGTVKRIERDFEGSIKAFQVAGDYYDEIFGIHLKPEISISEELISTVGSVEWKTYKSRVYERVMLRLYQALNFLEVKEYGKARAEIFKTRQAVQDAREIWKNEFEFSRKKMHSQSIDLQKIVNKSKKNEFASEIEKINQLFPSNLPDFVNPAALYLDALYFLHQKTVSGDFEKALYSLRQLLAIHPQNTWIREDYERSKKKMSSTGSFTYVFFETGRVPVRREKRFDLPLVFFSPMSRIPFLGITFPTLKTNENFLSGLDVYGKKNSTPVRTQLLADMDAIVAKEFEKDFPIELAKAISGAVTKAGLQYLGTDAIRSESDLTRVISGVGMGTLARSTTTADGRSWTTLPKQIQFVKISTPPSQRLILCGVGTNLEIIVPLESLHTNFVWVRSISTYSPLRIVSVFSLES